MITYVLKHSYLNIYCKKLGDYQTIGTFHGTTYDSFTMNLKAREN